METGTAGLVAVATDVGAWRVVLPVLRELDRRGILYRVMLAEPAATIARQDGVEHVALTAASVDQRVDAVLGTRPGALLLGTSVQAVVERALIRRIRDTGASVPTLGVLDAMLFVERRFGSGLAELPDVVACPDQATACRLGLARAPAAALAVTGNPTLEEIWLTNGGRLGSGTGGLGPEERSRLGLGPDRVGDEDAGRSGVDSNRAGTRGDGGRLGSEPERIGTGGDGGRLGSKPERIGAGGDAGRLGLKPERIGTWEPAPTLATGVWAGSDDATRSRDDPNLPAHLRHSDGLTDHPIDVLFVSSPVAAMRMRGAEFAIDEREALSDVLDALAALPGLAPDGYRVRVRLHPVQRSEGLPIPPPGIALEPDEDPDRLGSCARARVVVGLSSTLLGEARFLPRAAIAYLPGPFWEQEQVFAPEYGVRLARSDEQLQALLARALREPPDPPPLAGHLGAAGRIADLLQSLTSGGSTGASGVNGLAAARTLDDVGRS